MSQIGQYNRWTTRAAVQYDPSWHRCRCCCFCDWTKTDSTDGRCLNFLYRSSSPAKKKRRVVFLSTEVQTSLTHTGEARYPQHETCTPWLRISSWSEPTSPRIRLGRWHGARTKRENRLTLYASWLPKFLNTYQVSRYILRFEEAPTYLKTSGKSRQPPDRCSGIWHAESVVFPGNLSVQLWHRCSFRAGLAIQLVVDDDRT